VGHLTGCENSAIMPANRIRLSFKLFNFLSVAETPVILKYECTKMAPIRCNISSYTIKWIIFQYYFKG